MNLNLRNCCLCAHSPQYHGKSIEVERIFFEGFYEQKFQETEKFHVRKVKFLVRATERKMSVWRMETSDERENVAACAATLSRFLVAEVTQVVLRDFGSSGFEAMRRLPASTFSIWGYREQQNNDRSLKLTRGHDNESLLVYGLQMVYTKLRVHSTVERARVCNVKCNAIQGAGTSFFLWFRELGERLTDFLQLINITLLYCSSKWP